jgi:hypothetical protein
MLFAGYTFFVFYHLIHGKEPISDVRSSVFKDRALKHGKMILQRWH